MHIARGNVVSFQKSVWNFYNKNRRDFPWRQTTDPYHILVSEIMLQQTQVARVERKYPEFLNAFPSFPSLANTDFSKVLRVWSGMGYNRRAIALHKIAKRVMKEFGGVLPRDPQMLLTLPGIGNTTAHSIVAFAWNARVAFIETNIRRVFIHHFFPRKKKVSDEEIERCVAATLPKSRIREWYWALMDYGTYLAAQIPNPNRKSIHYRIQPAFKGSNREMRGRILRVATRKKSFGQDELTQMFGNDARINSSLEALLGEGFLRKKGKQYTLVS